MLCEMFLFRRNCADLPKRNSANVSSPLTHSWSRSWNSWSETMPPTWMNESWRLSNRGCEGWATFSLLVAGVGSGEIVLHFLKNLGRKRDEPQSFAFSRPLVALHSDDWGRVGVRDREGFELLRSRGLRCLVKKAIPETRRQSDGGWLIRLMAR